MVKALFCSLGLMLVGTAIISALPFLMMLGFIRSPATAMGVYLRVVYSVLISVPVFVLFQVNAMVYFFLALFSAQVNYDGALYGAAEWIERTKPYQAALEAALRASESLPANAEACPAAPADPQPQDAVGYNNRGFAWYNKGERDKAIADYDQALALDPNLAAAYNNRGLAWNKEGEYDKAMADFNQALALNPTDALAYNNRGNLWRTRGECGKAMADFGKAVTHDPKLVIAYNGLAFLLASCADEKYRDGEKAIENALKACQLTEQKNWDYIDTLAMAYAESGDFEKAKQWQTKAVELAPDEGSKRGCRSRLELYHQGKPYRQ
ncbi:MAG: tetratricopeptide repeat protein [Thermoguttaceae bacterium]